MGFNTFDSTGKQQLVNSIANMPFGSIISWGADVAPAGYLKCDGSAVSRTTYQDLFLAIGTNYGIGDGSTTFNLPDITGSIIYASAVAKAGSNLLPAVSDGSVTAAKLADALANNVGVNQTGVTNRSAMTAMTTERTTTSTSLVDVTGASLSFTVASGAYLIIGYSARVKIGPSDLGTSQFAVLANDVYINSHPSGTTASVNTSGATTTYVKLAGAGIVSAAEVGTGSQTIKMQFKQTSAGYTAYINNCYLTVTQVTF